MPTAPESRQRSRRCRLFIIFFSFFLSPNAGLHNSSFSVERFQLLEGGLWYCAASCTGSLKPITDPTRIEAPPNSRVSNPILAFPAAGTTIPTVRDIQRENCAYICQLRRRVIRSLYRPSHGITQLPFRPASRARYRPSRGRKRTSSSLNNAAHSYRERQRRGRQRCRWRRSREEEVRSI